MSNDPIQALQNAGIAPGAITEAERSVISQLSPEEIEILVGIRQRLAGGEPAETTGYAVLVPQGTQLGGSVSAGSLSFMPRAGAGDRLGGAGAGGRTNVAQASELTGWLLF